MCGIRPVLQRCLALNLADYDIPTGNRIEARLSGQVRAVVNVDVPATAWNRRYVRKGSRLASVP
jgi:hypothetical protein